MDEKYQDIAPYNDEEARAALQRLAGHPMLGIITKFLFPDAPRNLLSLQLRGISTVNEFQTEIMMDAVRSMINLTSEGFTYSGVNNLKKLSGKKFLLISNHRDITLDPALIQLILGENGIPMSEICVGSNLLKSQLLEDIMRSNRMIKVIRGIPAREMYLHSQVLSAYIRESITVGKSSVWIAQREGRTKNGLDKTEQGLLKMFDMSGKADFTTNFEELNIVPMSISYEIEPCDSRKARELYLSQSGPYVKKKNEDLHSILTGIRQKKGRVHITIGKPLERKEIEIAAALKGNDRYQELRGILDRRIIEGYRLWPNNYIAYDLLHESDTYSDKYTRAQKDDFIKYVDYKLSKLEAKIDKSAVRPIFLAIYANPVH